MPPVFAVQYCVAVGCTVVPEGRVMVPPGIAEIRAEKRKMVMPPSFAEETNCSVGSNVLQQYTLPWLAGHTV